MKRNIFKLALLFFALLTLMLVSCKRNETATPSNDATVAPPSSSQAKDTGPVQLPVRYQRSAYYTQDEQTSEVSFDEAGVNFVFDKEIM